MPMRTFAVLASLLLACLLAPAANAQGGKKPSEIRAELAKGFLEYLPYEISGKSEEDFGEVEFARIMAMLERLEAMVEELPAVDQRMLEEGSLADYLEPLFERFEPTGLPLVEQYRERGRISTTRYRMETLEFELMDYQNNHGEYPPMEAGLAAVIDVEDFMHEGLSHDGWGGVFLYSRPDEWTYAVRSLGADGERGTADDWVLTSDGGIAKPPAPGVAAAVTTPAEATPAVTAVEGALARHLVAELLPGEKLEGLSPRGGPEQDLLILEDGTTLRLLRGGAELGRIPVEHEVLAVSDLGAFCYLEESGDDTVLVAGDVRLTFEDGWAEAEYLAGTDTLLYTVGETTTCLNTGGEVLGDPATGLTSQVLAFRERRDDGYYVHTTDGVFGPVTWASNPLAILSFPEDAEPLVTVAFRLWDGEGTEVHVGDQVWSCTWAGDPIASRDGQHFAVLANYGGTPTEDWESDRDRRLERWQDPEMYRLTPAHQLFEGGTFSAILDGAKGPDFVEVSDPVFRRGNDWVAVLHRALDAEGHWQISHQSQELTGPTVKGKAVGPALIDGKGARSSFDYRDLGGHRYLESLDHDYETGEVYSRHAGPDAAFAYAIEDITLEQGRRIVWVVPDDEEPFRSSEVVQGHELYGWVGSPSRPVFGVYSEGKHGLFYGQGTYPAFDEARRPVIPRGDAGGQRMAQLVQYQGQAALAIHHLDEESIPVQDFGGRMTGADYPGLLPDGRVVCVVHLDTEPLAYFDYGRGEGGTSTAVVYDSGSWFLGGEADRVYGVETSEGGRIAWTEVHGEQQRVVAFDSGELTQGDFHDEVDDVQFLGEELVYVGVGERKQLFVDGVPVTEASWIYGLRQLPGAGISYGFGEGEQDYMMVGDVPVGPFGNVSRGTHHADLELLVFTADDAAYTSIELVVVSTRATDLGEVLYRERFEELEEDYLNRDRDRVVFYARSGDRIERMVLDLAGLRVDA